ncbi:MAG: hypothetical protein WC815_04170 [Vicinamibacterales bacterium]|jgi:hypothetical protein
MTRPGLLRFGALLALVAGGAMVSAQTLLPSTPPKGFGASITPAFEGWFDNADGTHTFMIGYFNRNTAAEVDVPLGPNNMFTPGTPDMGQPTHFLTGRRYGMFIYTVPKEFAKTQKLTWTLTVNGVTSKVPFYMSSDYNITPMRASEEGPRGYNVPPVLRFGTPGESFTGPIGTIAKAVSRMATVGVPMALDLTADDDAQYSSGANTPLNSAGSPVELVISKYRGPGNVTIADPRAKMTATKGGKPDQPFSGKAATTATFDEPGDYLLHVTANDYSGNGGGGAACCWTTALVKVSVKGDTPRMTGR